MTELIADLKLKSAEEQEEWFLSAVSGDNVPVPLMMELLSSTAAGGKKEQADEWADLLLGTLMENGDGESLMQVLRLMVTWQGSNKRFRKDCQACVEDVFKDRLGQMFVKSCGFDGKAPTKECLSRLYTLLHLKEGVLCYEKTWGFGVLETIDDFYKKITVNFERKPSHQMSFAYAGECLNILQEDHILAMKHRDAEAVASLVKNDAAEVVRIVLRSYGGLSAVDLKDHIVPSVIAEEQWKSFWDSARKVLKKDPLVDVPTKRTEPITLLTKEKECDAAWFDGLKNEKDPEQIIVLCRELDDFSPISKLDEPSRAIVVERMQFAVKAVERRRPDVLARLVIAAKRFGVTGESMIDDIAITAKLHEAKAFIDATSGMPAREVKGLLAYLWAYDAEKSADLFLSNLSSMQSSVLNEVMDCLITAGLTERSAQSLRSIIATRDACVEILYWLCRNAEWSIEQSIVKPADLAVQSVEGLEKRYMGESLKTQNQLRKLVGKKSWLSKITGMMNHSERKAFLVRINTAHGWDTTEKRSVLAKLIKEYPDLAKVLAGDTSDEEVTAKRGRFTSWRSYKQRQTDVRNIVEVDIPANSKEIAVARSYGDLRENAEYKAAKEQQGLLQRRRGEMEQDLKEVMGADFNDMASDRVGPGTVVQIKRASGTERSYCILGEWDRDEDLNIISSKSKLAEILMDHVKGDELMLPSINGEESGEITDISPITDEIKKWILDT